MGKCNYRLQVDVLDMDKPACYTKIGEFSKKSDPPLDTITEIVHGDLAFFTRIFV